MAAAVETEALRVRVNATGDDVDSLIPRNIFEAAVATELRSGEPVLTVEDAADMVALHAEEALVDVGFLVAAHGGYTAVFHRDLDVAAGATKTTRGFLPIERVGGS